MVTATHWIYPHKTLCISRGSVLLRWRCATLCTSGFMDDVTFDRNGRDAKRWKLHSAATAMSSVAIPGHSLMSMNACYCLFLSYNFCVLFIWFHSWSADLLCRFLWNFLEGRTTEKLSPLSCPLLPTLKLIVWFVATELQ